MRTISPAVTFKSAFGPFSVMTVASDEKQVTAEAKGHAAIKAAIHAAYAGGHHARLAHAAAPAATIAVQAPVANPPDFTTEVRQRTKQRIKLIFIYTLKILMKEF